MLTYACCYGADLTLQHCGQGLEGLQIKVGLLVWDGQPIFRTALSVFQQSPKTR